MQLGRVRALGLVAAFHVLSCARDGSIPEGGGAAPGAPAGLTFPRPCADLYAEDLLPTFELRLEPEEWSAIVDDCDREYHPAFLRYGAESAEVMVRNKGNWSFRCEKPQFVISFNEVDPQGRFHGLRKLVLDAPWYDHTVLRERLAFHFLARYGVESSCANSARLVVNGEYLGLYANVERIDREYLERHFEDPSGDLWKEGRELKTNEGAADPTRIDAFWAAGDVAALRGLVDLEQAIRVWAGEAMLPDRDSYWAGVEINFYLYDHPARGFLFLPYDADLSFASPDETTQGFDEDNAQADPLRFEHPDWGREQAMAAVLADAGYCERFVEAMRAARSAYDVPHLQGKLASWSTQIADAVAEDPRREFDDAEHRAALDYVHSFLEQRARFIDGWLQRARCPLE